MNVYIDELLLYISQNVVGAQTAKYLKDYKPRSRWTESLETVFVHSSDDTVFRKCGNEFHTRSFIKFLYLLKQYKGRVVFSEGRAPKETDGLPYKII